MSPLKQNNKFELSDGSYSVSDFPDYFEYLIVKHEMLTDNPPLRICINRIKNRTTFNIKSVYYPELLTPETKKLLRITEEKK